MDTDATAWRRRYRTTAVGIGAVTSVVSLIGGATFLAFSGDGPTRHAALTPRSVPAADPPPSMDPTPLPEYGMDFLGDISGAAATESGTAVTSDLYAVPSEFTPSGSVAAAALPALPPVALRLPQFQVAALPPVEDLLGPVQPYIQAYIDSVAQSVGADLAVSITGNALGTAANVALVALDGLIIYAAFVDDDGRLLTQLQNALPALMAPALAAEAGAPIPQFAGLSEAFAAVADMPLALGQQAPLQLPRAEDMAAGLAALSQLPPPQLPQLPRAEDMAAGFAALAQLPPPQLPQLPQLPRAEDVAGGIVAVAVTGLVLSAIFQPKPPSLTRMLGLPF